MRVLLVHNSYQHIGGEDSVVAAEARLLELNGHSIVRYERSNNELGGVGALSLVRSGIDTVWAKNSYHALRRLLLQEKPDVAHFHNTFPLISPSAYYACDEVGVPVVQTLHNYRLLCPTATFLRDGQVCEECLGRGVAWPGVVHGCYRNSRSATTAVVAMQAVHRALHTWQTKVHVYIALSEFARTKFIEGGLPKDRIIVKPNFVHPDPGTKTLNGEYALYVGRLSDEKGIRILLRAWARGAESIPLKIAGDGPILARVATEIHDRGSKHVDFLGRVPSGDIVSLLHGARFLVAPSICFENFPASIVEAFACGVPVIASRLGSMAEIVHDGVTGLHFEPANAVDLAEKAEWAWTHPEEMKAMGLAARAEYESRFEATRNHAMLLGIYRRAISTSAEARSAQTSQVSTSGVIK